MLLVRSKLRDRFLQTIGGFWRHVGCNEGEMGLGLFSAKPSTLPQRLRGADANWSELSGMKTAWKLKQVRSTHFQETPSIHPSRVKVIVDC